MQHLQYNSPMQLYSRETAEEQYRQQAAFAPNVPTTTPGPLGGGDRHFDPLRSETLKAIREQERGDEFGKNFFEKVAQAEAPNVPEQREPIWAEEARQKAERARSQTPGGHYYQQYYYDDKIPTGPPPNYTSGPELHPNPQDVQRWHQQRQMRSPSQDRHHAPSMLASEKGYLYGGMDFVDHSKIQPSDDYHYAYYPSKKHEKRELIRPGYNYGLDYTGKMGQIDDSDRYNYQGYGPQKGKLKSRYAADPHAPINTYVAENVESVNPIRLIGDTLSNQKIGKEKPLTEVQKHTFSTSFVPPPGFKRDHITVHPAPKPPEPICYSLSAKKRPQSAEPTRQNQIQYHARSRTPDASNNDRWNREGRKEVNLKTLLTDEALRIVKKPEQAPEWANRSQLRHISWSNRIPKTDQSEPNWTRISRRTTTEPPTRYQYKEPQPYWVNQSNARHNAWQNAADQYGVPGQNRNYSESYSYGGNVQYQNEQPHSQYNYYQNGTNYANPSNYARQTGQYSVRTTYTTDNPPPETRLKTTYSYQQSEPLIRHTPGQITNESSSTSKTENKFTTVVQAPRPPPITQGGNEKFLEQRQSRNFERTTEERIIPSQVIQQPEGSRIIQQKDMNRYYKKQTTEQQGYPGSRSTVLVSQKPEDFDRNREMAETLPLGSISNSLSNAEGSFVDKQGHNVSYRREVSTSADPGRECQLLKEEERRVIEEPVEPGVISRHITTKFYKKKTVTDTSTTTQ
uniref:Zasp-like motif domain-containing protein n=1 Tax=Panagrolaimus sp. JU765 TaxID=591449 RepID=A0AC34Q2M9_9BILA